MKVKSILNRKLATLTGIGAIAATLSLQALAMPIENPYGTLVHAGKVDREITLAGATKYVNVLRNETVKINAGGKSFVWRFDTLGTPIIELSDIAPPGINVKGVAIYVSLDPKETN